MSKLRIAIQKKGRLSEKSIQLLKECGIKVTNGTGKLKSEASNFPVELLFLRDDDIPQYVEQKVADVGILGENEVIEQERYVEIIQRLGFAACRLSLAIPKEEEYTGIEYFRDKSVATSYPSVLKSYFKEKGINVSVEKISGSVEIAPGIGLSDAICDIVSTGSTLMFNGLKEVEQVIKSEAVMISNKTLSEEKLQILEKLLFRIKSVLMSKEFKYILLNAPNDSLDKIISIIPGMKSPTILPLSEEGWSSLHSVVREDEFWEVIEQLQDNGAQGILVSSIEKMIL